MTKDYDDLMEDAEDHKIRLEEAINDKNHKDIIYYRGKYLYDLKRAYKIDSNGMVPSSVTGESTPIALSDVIKKELQLHQAQIDREIDRVKDNSSIKQTPIPKETALKFRKLSTRVSQVNFQTGRAQKRDVAADAVSILGTTLIKTPALVTSRVASKLGPLAVMILAFPLTAFASLMSFANDVTSKEPKGTGYTDTPIHEMSKTLQKTVKDIGANIYDTIAKI